MDNEVISTWVSGHLDAFKLRIRVFGDQEDINLTTMLTSSYVAVARLVGLDDLSTDRQAEELVFERARYVYNDALDEFMQNYNSEIAMVYQFYKNQRDAAEEALNDITSKTSTANS